LPQAGAPEVLRAGPGHRVRTFKNASPRSRIGRAMRRLLEALLVDRG